MLKSPTVIVDLSISLCNSDSFASFNWLLYYEAIKQLLRIVISSWRIDFFITMPFFLTLISFLSLQSALSEINIIIPAFFGLVLAWYIMLHEFIFNLNVSSY